MLRLAAGQSVTNPASSRQGSMSRKAFDQTVKFDHPIGPINTGGGLLPLGRSTTVTGLAVPPLCKCCCATTSSPRPEGCGDDFLSRACFLRLAPLRQVP